MNMVRFLERIEIEMMESVGCKLIRCDSTDGEFHFDCNWITKVIVHFDGAVETIGGTINGSQAVVIGKICKRLITNKS